MKRFFMTFLLFLCCFSLCSCQKSPVLNEVTSAEVEISCQDEKYRASIERTQDDGINITMLSPKNIEGVSYRFAAEELTIDYQGLRCITDHNYLPQGAVSNALYEVFSAIPKAQYQESENKEDRFSVDDGRFLIRAEGGEIKEISDTRYGYHIVFEKSGR